MPRDNHTHIYGFCRLSMLNMLNLMEAIWFFRTDLQQDQVDTWILIGDTSMKHPTIHSKRYVNAENTQ